MASSQPSNQNTSNGKHTAIVSDRDHINRILTEFGLNPSEYTFSSPQELTTTQPSAIPKSSADNSTLAQLPTSLVAPARPLTWIQQPPPPPVINREQPKEERSDDMAQQLLSPRRLPPPPPVDSEDLPDSKNDNSKLTAEYYLSKINATDNPPVKVVRPSEQNLVYRKDIRIRYLQPPTPPPPAPIIIREKQLPPKPPESPILIRERKPEPQTPPPLTIRERAPTPPPLLEPVIIDKNLPPPPPQPRQIIIERLPTPPPKPRTVIFEKWLPYKKVKRPILLEKAPPLPEITPTRNVIIEYEPLKAYTVRRVIEEGIFRVDPNQFSNYVSQHNDGNVRVVDRIDDLPPPSEDLMHVLQQYNQSSTSNDNDNSLSSGQLKNILQSANMATPPKDPVQSTRRISSSHSSASSSFEFPQQQIPRDAPLQIKTNNIF